MTTTSITCPVCGSKDLKKTTHKIKVQLTQGPTFDFMEVIFKCNTCQEESDPSGESDKNFLEAQKAAQIQMINNGLRELKKQGITMSFFERIFELPARTLTRWKRGDFSSVSIALFRIIKTYPWITQVAENKFEKSFAERALIEAASMSFIVSNDTASTGTIFSLDQSSHTPYYLPQTING